MNIEEARDELVRNTKCLSPTDKSTSNFSQINQNQIVTVVLLRWLITIWHPRHHIVVVMSDEWRLSAVPSIEPLDAEKPQPHRRFCASLLYGFQSQTSLFRLTIGIPICHVIHGLCVYIQIECIEIYLLDRNSNINCSCKTSWSFGFFCIVSANMANEILTNKYPSFVVSDCTGTGKLSVFSHVSAQFDSGNFILWSYFVFSYIVS